MISSTITTPTALVGLYVCALVGLSPTADAQSQHVTLPNGRTFEVATERGLPRRFRSNDIQVRDLGITARIEAADSGNVLPFMWLIQARVRAAGHFRVTITSPLDDTLSSTFEFTGPGDLRQSFFPAADYPTIWAGLDSSGTDWFPFRFEFLDAASQKRFEFVQWAQLDSATMAESRRTVEQVRELMRQRQPRRDSTPPDN
jgi:hypothetical protein